MSSNRVICFRHPHYDGKDSPILTCKTCCGIFVTAMKAKMVQKDSDKTPKVSPRSESLYERLEMKNDETTIYGFNPSAI